MISATAPMSRDVSPVTLTAFVRPEDKERDLVGDQARQVKLIGSAGAVGDGGVNARAVLCDVIVTGDGSRRGSGADQISSWTSNRTSPAARLPLATAWIRFSQA